MALLRFPGSVLTEPALNFLAWAMTENREAKRATNQAEVEITTVSLLDSDGNLYKVKKCVLLFCCSTSLVGVQSLFWVEWATCEYVTSLGAIRGAQRCSTGHQLGTSDFWRDFSSLLETQRVNFPDWEAKSFFSVPKMMLQSLRREPSSSKSTFPKSLCLRLTSSRWLTDVLRHPNFIQDDIMVEFLSSSRDVSSAAVSDSLF